MVRDALKTISKTQPADLNRRPTTAHEVARLAGVSQSAVSRVFTPGASVSEETRKKVTIAAKRLGYRPNFSARALITGRSNIIGVAVPGVDNPFYADALNALSLAFAARGYRALLFSVDPSVGTDPILEEVLRYRVDALVLISTSASSHFAEECTEVGLPVVMFNRKADSGSGSSVVGDNVVGAGKLAAFLLEGGHQRFAFVAGLEEASTSRDREKGYLEYLASKEVYNVSREVGNFFPADTVKAVRSLMKKTAPPDAIFCANDQMAMVAMDIVRFEFAKTPGVDISIVGFDDIAMASWPSYALTTYSQPIERMVEQTVVILDTQLKNRSADTSHHVTQGELIVRTSARRASA